MKKLVINTVVIISFIGIVLVIGNMYILPSMNIEDKEFSWNILYKGLKGCRDFTVDEDNNTYIAFENKIQKIDPLGKSKVIYDNKDLDINFMEYYNKALYIATDNRIMVFDLIKGTISELLKDIPNLGDFNKNCLIIKDDKLYVTIGAVTNAGVVGDDNKWLKDNPLLYDRSPIKIVLKGENFNKGTTGAFVPYHVKGEENQEIQGLFPGNSSIITYDFSTYKWETYCYGVRNINGLDYTSQGNIYGTVGGIEPRGERGIQGDKDYIYEFKKNLWYGWPDFTGGDPIISPRFKSSNDKPLNFIIKNHLTENPEGPYYQHKTISALGTMAIDRNGIMGNKDDIYFYDKNENIIYVLGDKVKEHSKIKITKGNIGSLKFTPNSLRALDGEKGLLYDITNSKSKSQSMLNNGVLYGGIIIIVAMILAMIKKLIN